MKSKKTASTNKWVSKSIKTCKAPQLTDSKYKSRPSPAAHADSCKDAAMFGNDKRLYISKPDSRNIYKWIPMTHRDDMDKPPSNTYYTQDNGSRPFKVVIKGKELSIYGCNDAALKELGWYQYAYYDFITKYKASKIFIGDDPEKINGDYSNKHPGSSIIAEISKHKYVFIGESVYEFETESPITMFRSPIGNSDVPYPFAQDNTFTYLMIEDVKLCNSDLSDLSDVNKPFDPYGRYYMWDDKYKSMPKLQGIKFVKKVVVTRQ
jgi:hypothetical protein